MAQLSQDCFAFGGKPLSLPEAQQALGKAAQELEREESLGLDDLAGRVLSRPVLAQASVPPFLNSAVEGYAYRHGPGPDRQIIGTLAAGDTIPGPLPPGQAYRILTGAPLPPGADTVLMEEDAVLSGAKVSIPPALPKGSNARPEGEDLAKGQLLYRAGHQLSRLDIARLAAGGLTQAWVYAPLEILILSSGDEIRSGQIADTNRWILRSVFSGPAFALTYGGVLADDLEACRRTLRQAKADLILTSGGVSVGERDFIRQALEEEGSLRFWRVAVKPGRPVAFGEVGDSPLIGLPGNPVACFITAQFLALPFARARLGQTASENLSANLPTFQAPLSEPYQKKRGRTEFVRVLQQGDGSLAPYPVAGAGILTSLTAADALAILGPDLDQIPAGTLIPVIPMRGIL